MIHFSVVYVTTPSTFYIDFQYICDVIMLIYCFVYYNCALYYNFICVTISFVYCVRDRLMLWNTKSGQTPLLKAAFRGHLDVVRFLVTEAKVDPHQRNEVGKAYG